MIFYIFKEDNVLYVNRSRQQVTGEGNRHY